MSLSRAFLVLVLSIFYAQAKYLTKKFCDDVGPSKCMVHNVWLDPCEEGPNFCSLKKGKPYTLTADLTPKFSATKLKLAMYGDSSNIGSFDRILKTPQNACSTMICPVENLTRQIFDINFSFSKNFTLAKFPVKVKIWNEDDDTEVTEACCFTFNVKLKK